MACGRHHTQAVSVAALRVRQDSAQDVELTLAALEQNRLANEVVVARDGEEALIVAAEENPELILLDWALPNLSGIEVCRRLRAKSDSRNVCTIIRSNCPGASNSELRSHALS